MTTTGDTTDLTRDTSSDTTTLPTFTIPTLASGSSYSNVSDFPANKWGYKKDSSDYIPFSSPTPLLENTVATNGDTTTLSFGSKIDYTQPSGAYKTTLIFTATTNPMVNYIQDLNPTLCTTTPMTVVDKRDGQEYTVQRLQDGNCWMMTNLNLGATTLTTDLTSANTNLSTTVTASTFNGWKKSTGSATYTAGEYIPVSGTDSTSQTPYGTLYNYCAASAGTICTSSNSLDASYDICPKGWRLPTGGSSGEFQTLYNNSSYNTYAKMRAPISSGGAAFALAGLFSNAAPVNQSSSGNYWSSTRNNNTNMYLLYLNTSSVTPADDYNRNSGYSIRCVMKPKTMQDFTTTDASAMAANETRYLQDARDGRMYSVAKLADNQIWMTSNLNLAGGTVLSNDLSDVPSANYYTLPASSTSGFSSDTTAYVYNSNNNSNNCGSSTPCNSYYSWLAATAGGKGASGTAVTGNGPDAAYSICPKGWHLPKSGNQSDTSNPTTTGYKKGDFYKLATAYGVNLESSYYQNSAVFYNNVGPGTFPNFLLAGYYDSSSFYYGGVYGYYWSSSSYSSTNAYNLGFLSSHVNSANYGSRRFGLSVRCIFGS